MKKELKSGILSADKSADGRPTVFLVNVIAVLNTYTFRDIAFAMSKILKKGNNSKIIK